jgi:SAM-dependent methyltransferase
MSTPPAKRTVEEGYDRVADAYAELERGTQWPRMRWVRRVLAELPEGADVLDLGCGGGEPVGPAVLERHRYTGVDISARQIELARRNVPGARFIHGDLTSVGLADGSFDAVFSFYAIDHVPREEHAGLFRDIHRLLRRGGVLLVSVEAGDEPAITGDWLGSPMFFSHYDEETTIGLVDGAGFEILESTVEEQTEGDHAVPYLWLLARSPVAAETRGSG